MHQAAPRSQSPPKIGKMEVHSLTKDGRSLFDEVDKENAEKLKEAIPKKKRGRPRKVRLEEEAGSPPVKKKRGRPIKSPVSMDIDPDVSAAIAEAALEMQMEEQSKAVEVDDETPKVAKEKTPKPVKEKTPRPVKEKTPRPVKEKTPKHAKTPTKKSLKKSSQTELLSNSSSDVESLSEKEDSPAPPAPPAPRRRGRPKGWRKNKDGAAAKAKTLLKKTPSEATAPRKKPAEPDAARRPRGRPRKTLRTADSIARHLRSKDVILIDDEDDEIITVNAPEELEQLEQVVQTYTQKVRTESMHKNWLALAPTVQTQLEGILSMFVDQAITSMDITRDADKVRYRTLMMSEVVRPLLQRFKHVKLPPGIKESHLNLEVLEDEKMRLESNYDANLRQLSALQAELVTETEKLQGEQTYQKKYEADVRHSEKEMASSLEELEGLLGDEIDIEAADSGNLGLSTNESQQNLVSDSIGLEDKSAYSAAEDTDLSETLGDLQRELDRLTHATAGFKGLSEVVQRVHNTFNLA